MGLRPRTPHPWPRVLRTCSLHAPGCAHFVRLHARTLMCRMESLVGAKLRMLGAPTTTGTVPATSDCQNFSVTYSGSQLFSNARENL